MQIRPYYRILFLCFAVLGVYYPILSALTNSLDDRSMITSLLNTDRFDWKAILLPGTSGYYYRPLLILTFIADKHLWGLEASFMHLENVLLHTANTIILYFIAEKILRKEYGAHSNIALLSALLFAIHPINTEAVDWISGRTDVLAGTFVLLSFLFLLIAWERRSRGKALLGAVFLLLGCLSKEVALFFCPAALLILYCLEKQRAHPAETWRTLYRDQSGVIISYSLTALVYLLLRFLALRKGDNSLVQVTHIVGGDEGISRYFDALRITMKAFGYYAKKLFVPWPLNFAIVQVSDLYTIIGAMVVVLCLYLVLYRRDMISALVLTGAFFILPAVLNILAKIAWTPLAERYLYLASAPFCIVVVTKGSAISEYYKLRKIAPFLVAIMLFGAASTTFSRNIVWQSNLTLFEDTAAKSPGFIPVMHELASAYYDHGRVQDAADIISSVHEPVNLKSRELVDYNKALMMYRQNDYEGARKLLIENINRDSVHFPGFIKLLIQIEEKRISGAESEKERNEYRRAIIEWLKELYAVEPDFLYIYRQGQYYLAMNNRNEALRCFQRVIDMAPSDVYYRAAAEKLIKRLGQKHG